MTSPHIFYVTQTIFSNISKIIERGKKSSTYKYALLRGTIDIIQENSPYLSYKNDKVYVPLGLLVEKWILYYYPIFELDISQNTSKNSSFELRLKALIKYYEKKGNFSAFYNDLHKNNIPDEFKLEFFELLRSIRETICDMPMKHIGNVLTKNHYSIFKPTKYKIFKSNFHKYSDRENIINDFGEFSIPIAYYEAFKIFGSFINGKDSILFKWAEFSAKASGDNLSIGNVVTQVLKSPITEREILESKKLYKQILEKKGNVYCVWTGKKLKKYDVDHIIPFSVWKNNDLWNLLPSNSNINRNQKKDKIPSPILIEKQKDIILNYWNLIFKEQSVRFKKEFQIALLGNLSFDEWQQNVISQLKESCTYLIENRGFEEWKN